ncbi:alpha/beta hydrolase family protein [Leucobacter sp. USHLN153]|uniref:alpha/beta hydrolase family protein n=1 Tax=Leucobacter sp. USHLN153 TaxID=3081268 RepID=UPI003015C329
MPVSTAADSAPPPPFRTSSRRVPYGDDSEQWFDLHRPRGKAAALGTVVLIHGGYWRGKYSADLMGPMAADLTARGWACPNIEYRRVGAGGGWPTILEDAIAASRQVAALVARGELPGPLLVLGHSVGGQLALLVARELRASIAGVLALAPVTDVVETWRARLGTDAAGNLLAASEGDPMTVANAASPRFQLPIGVRSTVFHGVDDSAVPIEHTRRFVSEARAAGDNVQLFDLGTLDHLAAIEPEASHWPLVTDALEALRHSAASATAPEATTEPAVEQAQSPAVEQA